MLFQTNTGNQFIKNYTFDFDFGRPWGNNNVVMTCVSGHLTKVDFAPEFQNWDYPPPEALFSAAVRTIIGQVSS